MSVSPTPKEQYNTIKTALESGNRVAYDKSAGRFVEITKSEAKKGSSNYITDLPTLKTKVKEFIEEHGIEEGQKANLEAAFDTRAEKLSNRFVLFGGKVRDKAVRDLKGLKDTVHKTSKQKSKISSEVPSSKGGFKPPVGAVNVMGMSPPSSSEGSKVGEGVPPPMVEEGGFEAPPMGFPAPPMNAPPAPMSGMVAEKYSFSHRKLFKNADALPTLKGEPKHPELRNENHDFGKINSTIKKEVDREAYAKSIETYLLGTGELKTVKKGLSTTTELVREKNGLKHAVEKGETVVSKHAELDEQVKGKELQVKTAEAKLKEKEENLKQLEECLKDGQPYMGARVTSKGSFPVIFYPEAQLKEMRKFLEEHPEQREFFVKKGLDPDNCRSLEWKIADLKEEGRETERGLRETKKAISHLEKGMGKLKLEALKMMGVKDKDIPKDETRDTFIDNKFREFSQLVSDKRKIFEGWDRALGTLKKEASAVEEKTTTVSESEAALDEFLKAPELGPLLALKGTVDSVKSDPMGANMEYASKVDNFYRNTV